jgi:CHAD domain-containing protein
VSAQAPSVAVRAKVDVPLAYDQRADAAAVAVLRRLLTVVRDNIEGSIKGDDDEYLHQLRIAVRRSRTVQRQLAGVFPPVELPGYRSEFKWLQQATGPARDLDVYVGDLDSLRDMLPERFRDDLGPLGPVLLHGQTEARAEMTQALRSERAANLFEDWDRLLETLVELPLEDRPSAQRPVGEVAGRRIRKVYKRIVHMGRRIDDSSPAEDYHELRKKGKELRYLLELFGRPLYPADVVKPMIKTLKALQDVLGRHHDREVQAATLRSLREEVSALPGGPAALMAMGLLVERVAEDQRGAHREFQDVFAAFGSKGQRRLVKETFG